MRLEDYGEALAYDVAFWMQGLDNPAYPIERLGDLAIEVSEKLRALATITLLVKAEPDFFFHNLIRSGRTRLGYLRRMRDAGRTDDHHDAAGRHGGLLDAIVAGDLVLAREIGDAAPSDFHPEREYEDDYCFARLVHALLDPAVAPDAVAPLIRQLEAYLDGEPSARLAICRAILVKDQEGFTEGFAAILTEYAARIELDKNRGRLEDPVVVANRQVSVEALALLRLAELHGIRTEPEYPYCPSLARVEMVAPFPGE